MTSLSSSWSHCRLCSVLYAGDHAWDGATADAGDRRPDQIVGRDQEAAGTRNKTVRTVYFEFNCY